MVWHFCNLVLNRKWRTEWCASIPLHKEEDANCAQINEKLVSASYQQSDFTDRELVNQGVHT